MNRDRKLDIYWRVLALLLVLSLLAACTGPAEQAPGQAEETGEVEVTGIPQSDAEVTEMAQATEGGELPGTGGTPAPGATSGAAFSPPESEVCQKVAEDVQATLAAEEEAVAVEEAAPFEDYIANQAGTGCQVTVTGTGADFPDYESFVDMAEGLNVVMQSTGWEPDPAYVADSPTGTAYAMRMEDLLALVRVDMEPAPEAGCPEDQPISECELTPEQMNYTIQVNVARQAQQQQ